MGLLDKASHLLAVVSILRKVGDITLSNFESVLLSISQAKTKTDEVKKYIYEDFLAKDWNLSINWQTWQIGQRNT